MGWSLVAAIFYVLLLVVVWAFVTVWTVVVMAVFVVRRRREIGMLERLWASS